MIQNTKIFGLILIFFGIAIILWALYTSNGIFTTKKPVPELFKIGTQDMLSEPTDNTEQAQDSIGIDLAIPDILQNEAGDMLKNQIQTLLPEIPSNAIVKLLNLLSWAIFSMIVMSGGSKISILGIRLIK